MSEREDFEKLFKEFYPLTGVNYLGIDENGEYNDCDTRVAFNIYSRQQKKIDELKEATREIIEHQDAEIDDLEIKISNLKAENKSLKADIEMLIDTGEQKK